MKTFIVEVIDNSKAEFVETLLSQLEGINFRQERKTKQVKQKPSKKKTEKTKSEKQKPVGSDRLGPPGCGIFPGTLTVRRSFARPPRRLVRALGIQNRDGRLEQDLKVEEDAPILDVKKVVLN